MMELFHSNYFFLSTLFHSVSFDQTFLSPLIKGGRGVVKRKVWKKKLEEKFAYVLRITHYYDCFPTRIHVEPIYIRGVVLCFAFTLSISV